MKNLILSLFIILISCSKAPVKSDLSPMGLEAMLSPEDLRIHRCLHSGPDLSFELKKECLTGTAYEGSLGRMPSNGDDEIIMKNNWFFSDPSNLDQFYAISRGFVRANTEMVKHATNDRGIAVEASAFFGFGGGWLAEFINHHGELGLFCAPFYNVKTDAGVEAAVAVIQSVSCKSNQAYQGGFLNISAGISGELIGIPADLSMAYSFGVDLPTFVQLIRQARGQQRLEASKLARELALLGRQDVQRALAGSNSELLALLSMSLRPIGTLGVGVPQLVNSQRLTQLVRKVITHNKSLAVQFKSFYLTRLSPYFRRNNFPQLDQFFSILTRSMTGCDSIGGAAALSLSASPVSFGIAYENYHLLFEMPFSDLRAFKALTPMILLNPFLMSPEDLRATVRMARGVLAIPGKAARQCDQVFPRI